jgi:hypothetical protein
VVCWGTNLLETPRSSYRHWSQLHQIYNTDVSFGFVEQMSHALNGGSFSDVAQMAYPSLGSQDLSIRPSQDGFQMWLNMPVAHSKEHKGFHLNIWSANMRCAGPHNWCCYCWELQRCSCSSSKAFNRVVTAVLHRPGFYCVQKELRKSSWSPQSVPHPTEALRLGRMDESLDGWKFCLGGRVRSWLAPSAVTVGCVLVASKWAAAAAAGCM